MADEATIEQETETGDPVAEFQEFLDARPAAEEVEDEPEQDSGVEDSAVVDAGDEPAPVADATVAEPVAEGPSFLMKQEAERAGLDPKLIAVASNDAQLEQMIVVHKDREQPKDATDVDFDDTPLAFDLPEDEYPADDPVRKALGSVVEGFNKRLQQRDKVIAQLAGWTNEQIDRADREAQESQLKEHAVLVAPFDEVLDSFNSDVFGKTGTKDPKQVQSRVAAWEKYFKLGADAKLDKDILARKALLAAEDYRPGFIEQRTKTQQAVARQKRNVIGGGNSRPVGPAKTREDAIKEWNDALTGKKPLEL